jgi:hypothetical protein
MADISLVQLWHLHQPITQVKKWVDRAVAQAYRPLMEIYRRHPSVRYNLNITGSLVDLLERWAPELLKDAVETAATHQMEPTTTAYYQPIMAFLPKEHAVAQIVKNTRRVEDLFHRRPTVAWVPERAWEPQAGAAFVEAGVEAVVLDDRLSRGRPKGWRHRTWLASGHRGRLKVFLIDEEMRYMVPWKPVDHVLRRLDEIADGAGPGWVVTCADDGEKMGLWPGTEDIHPWLEAFLEGLEERPWIKTITMEEYLSKFSPIGEGEFTAGSYREMEEWCLGDMRNWLRHPVVRDMHARFQMTVSEVEKSWEVDEVLRAAVNDPYWYARRMTYHRQEVYRDILRAEARHAWSPGVKVGDFNGDGSEDGLLQDLQQRVFIGGDGRIYEWDDKDFCHNFVNTGFQDLDYQEDKALKDRRVFDMPRRNCITDYLDGTPLSASGLEAQAAGLRFSAERRGLHLLKEMELRGSILECRYRIENRSPVIYRGKLGVEFCFTLPTDTVDASVRDYHRQIFDYAGAAIDRPVEFETDGPGVSWSSAFDTLNGVVAGAAWEPGTIETHGRGIRAEAISFTPVFPVDLAPGRARELRFRAAVGRGDPSKIAGLLPELL